MEIEIGQNWSVWVPGRQQWLLATVTRRDGEKTVLKYDARYDLGRADAECVADEMTILGNTNLFRLLTPHA